MKLGYYSDTTHIDHDVGDMHPEHPMRIIAINHELDRLGVLQDAHRGGGSQVSQQDLLRAHRSGYIKQLLKMSPENGSILASVDTPMSVGTLRAAYHAAGCVVEALDDLLQDKVDRAFCSVRPPGHHAERNKSMGFCFLNNVAIAAKKAQQEYGLERIAVIDFDVHQGNGTIDILANDPAFLICSSFQHPCFPFSHWRNIYSNVINSPLGEGTGGLEMRRALEAQWLKQLQDFKPQLTIVSAGFDAHTDDPVAELNWTDSDYTWLGGFLSEINKENSNNKILAVLEGGYDLDALATSCAKFIIAFKD
jgi:acetoin utilization deacetylase AcuC-like enzyme